MKKRVNLVTKFLIWRKKHISDTKFLNILCVVVGFLTGLSAVLIKKSVYYIREFLTKGFVPEYFNLNYVLYPIIGILLLSFLRNLFSKSLSDTVYQTFCML